MRAPSLLNFSGMAVMVPKPCSVDSHAGEEPKAFPAHQPVLDPPEVKENYNSFMTSSKEAYTDPRVKSTKI